MSKNIEHQYLNLLQDILDNGVEKQDRTGTGTISAFGRQIRHDMKQGFPLLTTKRMAVKTMMTELKWFLKGDTNIKYLVDNNCNIWNGDAYKKYADIECNPPHDHSLSKNEFIEKIKTDDEFANKWGELGPVYGKQWRGWGDTIDLHPIGKGIKYFVDGIDQIANLINDIKTNPDSRRLMVNAWNVGELDQMTLPPCHYGFQVYTRELSGVERLEYYAKHWFTADEVVPVVSHIKLDSLRVPKRAISLMWNQRSVDTFLGLPFNIASYGLLLEIISKEVNMVPDELIGNLGDTHLYQNHIEQAEEQLDRFPFELPKLKLSNVDILNGEFNAELVGYKSHPAIKASLSN